MSRARTRLGALLTAAALALTACASGGDMSGGGASSGAAPSQSLDAVPVLQPSPRPGPEPGQPGYADATDGSAQAVEVAAPVLTQEDVDAAIAEVMGKYRATAVSVATVEDGVLSQSGAWGWAVKNEREMSPDTKVRIASISKVVIAMCAMAMAEEGIVDLDAPISDYWGAGAVNPYSRTQPTIRTFMTHTSSIKNLDTTRGLSTLRGILQSRSSWRSMEPGNGGYWSYSNFGMCILGTTLELAYNGLLDDYLQQHFLEPIGAKASFCGGKLDVSEVATLYTTGGIGRSAAEHAGQTIPTQIGQTASYFPGGFTVSAVDMAKLVSVLANDGVYKEREDRYIEISPSFGGVTSDVQFVMSVPSYKETRLLSEESVADMESPRFTVSPGDTAPFDQCLILRRQEDVLGRDVIYYHTGSAYGVFSLMTYDPETRDGIVVITTGASRNMNEHGMYALCYDLMDILYHKMEEDPT